MPKFMAKYLLAASSLLLTLSHALTQPKTFSVGDSIDSQSQLLHPNLENSVQCNLKAEDPMETKCQGAFGDMPNWIFRKDFTKKPDGQEKPTEFQLPQYFEWDDCFASVDFKPGVSQDRDSWMHIYAAGALSSVRCELWAGGASGASVTGGHVDVGRAGGIRVKWGTKEDVVPSGVQPYIGGSASNGTVASFRA